MNRREFVAGSVAVAGGAVLGPEGLAASARGRGRTWRSSACRGRCFGGGDAGGSVSGRIFCGGWLGGVPGGRGVERGWQGRVDLGPVCAYGGQGQGRGDRAMWLAISTTSIRRTLRLLKRLNQKSYRFSISWARMQPAGTGAPNTKGIDHYSRLVDALLEAGIRPFCTIYHWDLPQALEDRGGWPNRDLAGYYAELCGDAGEASGRPGYDVGAVQYAVVVYLLWVWGGDLSAGTSEL